MKRQRSLRPDVESLEKLALLSTSVVPHAAFHAAVPALVRGTPSTGVHLVGGIGSGRGYVSPLGSVRFLARIGEMVVGDVVLVVASAVDLGRVAK